MNGDNPRPPEVPGGWQFNPNGSNSESHPQVTDGIAPVEHQEMGQHVAADEGVSWTASEFVIHEKGIGWYSALAGSVLVFSALVYLVTRDKITIGIILFAAIVFGVYANRKPQTLPYRIDSAGLTAGSKFYDFDQFRSFAVIHEGAFSSVSFMPLQRFMPIITVYYSPDDEAKIVQILSARLPVETHGRDVIDRFLHRIRF